MYKDLSEKIRTAFDIKLSNFGNEIEFAYPNQTLALSTTSNKCSLKCAHCNGHYLENMIPIEDYEEKVKSRNITSFLLSGGCSYEGDVPINTHIQTIKELKEQGYRLNAHLGLMDKESIIELCKYLDMVSFDLVFDKETIKEVYKMDKSKDDYIKTYNTIRENTEVAPHICIGLKGGKVKGEYEIIEYLQKNPPNKLTFIVLIPTRGTEYENVEPPKLEEVADVLCEARINLPNTEINLGCMRPRGVYRKELDQLAIMCGVNKIVLPSKSAKNKAIDMNMTITECKECCVL
ncbi:MULTISPECIES: radical SAM protein [unclassified Clostridioides]|uniref:radical SAM protein n=1 Tax=unclassified Clostridioides TaxID=2635829 RepID=UPI001D0FFF80|nr:radical SAM protein [Clostridioides sp. ZZV14-6150]MCC0661430.1 radical SAM protein [Clostridioides sp. ZZV14-6154]MCC0668690.1 radical SAM protein [Clostridioides sp. ZZV14-6153]MCC0717944.1 radical SAM protein [Clostridioides sp. ZZV14-6105]MCC0721970.1 radical SAM protein [Clostridioides sp. ZZV14-6104]MCC0726005.1 radical SAM protein [Clostridioides sp. ZZV14-6045]MCC0731820.1 radical SAM protein [Clostridioides sp. ZZV14-6048]MCC0735148.1 radical SAM protein [Clostridioides sp. ZZV14